MGADNQSQLDILIRTIADTTGFTLTREQAAATQQAIGKYADSTQDLGKKTEETGLIQEKSTAHARAQFMLFGELNKIVPGLGMAIHAAFAGPLGPIILLAAGIAEVTHLIKEQNAALDEQAKAGANADFLSGISARLDAIRSLNEENAKYVLKLADLEAGEHGITTDIGYPKLFMICARAIGEPTQQMVNNFAASRAATVSEWPFGFIFGIGSHRFPAPAGQAC